MIKLLVLINIFFGMITDATNLSFNIGPINLNLFRISLLLIILLMVLKIGLKDKAMISIKKSDNHYSIVFMLIWLLWGLGSVFWVKDLEGWLNSITYLSLGFILCAVYSRYLNRSTDLLLAFRTIGIMVLFHNLIGWYEFFSQNYLFINDPYIAAVYGVGRLPVSSFGNTNDFATFLFLSIWIMYVCMVNSKTRITKILSIALMTSSFVLILATNSRANLLGFLLSVIVFLFLSFKKRNTRNILVRFVLLGLGLMFVFVWINPNVFYDFLSGLIKNSDFDLSRGLEGSSESTRLNLILNSFIFLVRTFGFGVGSGNIEYWLQNEVVFPTNNTWYIHNWWIEIMAVYGILIFIMYIIFYVKLMKSMYKKFMYSDNKIDTTISLSIIVFMIGFIIASISSHSNLYNEWLWIFWGIAVAFQGTSLNRTSPNSISKE